MSKFCQRIKERWSTWAVWIIPLVLILVEAITLWSLETECQSQFLCSLFGVEKKVELVPYFGWLMAGTISITGLVIANRRAKAMNAHARSMADSVNATTVGQRQERFRDAITHLGHENASVRQGGAHSLFHLALDEEKLRPSIAEILCAHIRETTRSKNYQEQHDDEPSTEIQSLVELLFTRRKLEGENEKLDAFWKGIRPNLAGCYLRGIELRFAVFPGADLRSAQFQGAQLFNAQFEGAILLEAQFEGAILLEVQFQDASLAIAQFQGAQLYRAQFQCADLCEAQFQGAKLYEAQFQSAYLGEAQFQSAYLNKAQFQGASSKVTLPQGDYETRIRNRIGCASELDSVIFSGGLDNKQVKELTSALEKALIFAPISERRNYIEENIKNFKDGLQKHIGKPKSNKPPDDVSTGAYSKEEAERWIKEYKDTLAEGRASADIYTSSGKDD